MDEDGTVLKAATEYEYGTPAADIVKPADPTKEATAQYTYTFAGWDPQIADVTEDATYTATYDEVTNKYKVTFVDEDGTTILKEATEYDYGTPADEIEQPEYPTKEGADGTVYIFDGWDPEIAEVTEDATYTATYVEFTASLTGTDVSVEYDGTGHTTTFELVYPEGFEEAEITYSYDGHEYEDVPEFVNAGKYEVTASAIVFVYNDFDESNIELEATATIEITARAITITSGSASRAYDGTPLVEHSATITAGSLAPGDTVEYSYTGTITDPGTTPNYFTADFGRVTVSDNSVEEASAPVQSDDNRPQKQVDGFDINKNYDVTYVYGTLEITGGPTPPPTPPTPPTYTVDPTPTPVAPAPAVTPAVLGATRDIEEIIPEEPAVLGESRTRQTGDESQIPGRLLLIMICAGAIATIMITTRKKEEQQ